MLIIINEFLVVVVFPMDFLELGIYVQFIGTRRHCFTR